MEKKTTNSLPMTSANVKDNLATDERRWTQTGIERWR
jgi:hypothetical protein